MAAESEEEAQDQFRYELGEFLRSKSDLMRLASGEIDIDEDHLLGDFILVLNWVGHGEEGYTHRIRGPGTGYNTGQGLLHTALYDL